MIKLTKKQDKARTAFINNVRSVIAGNIYLELKELLKLAEKQ